jgi:hypothetical protein
MVCLCGCRKAVGDVAPSLVVPHALDSPRTRNAKADALNKLTLEAVVVAQPESQPAFRGRMAQLQLGAAAEGRGGGGGGGGGEGGSRAEGATGGGSGPRLALGSAPADPQPRSLASTPPGPASASAGSSTGGSKVPPLLGGAPLSPSRLAEGKRSMSLQGHPQEPRGQLQLSGLLGMVGGPLRSNSREKVVLDGLGVVLDEGLPGLRAAAMYPWQEVKGDFDKATGLHKVYYFNVETKRTKWEIPNEVSAGPALFPSLLSRPVPRSAALKRRRRCEARTLGRR